jgi:hypothetical protein
MHGHSMSKNSVRKWLIITGVPLALWQIVFSFFLDGWMSPVMAISGTLIACRTLGLISEGKES